QTHFNYLVLLLENLLNSLSRETAEVPRFTMEIVDEGRGDQEQSTRLQNSVNAIQHSIQIGHRFKHLATQDDSGSCSRQGPWLVLICNQVHTRQLNNVQSKVLD